MIEGIKEEYEEHDSSDFIARRNSIHIWLEEVDFLQPPLTCKRSRWISQFSFDFKGWEPIN
jgi:hypothetical protein